jgi:HD-GYP domain-containing protein (c-di-GMP phosphodiesterase class II)
MGCIDKMRNKLKIRFGTNSLDVLSHTSLYFKLFIISFSVFAITILAVAYQLERQIADTHIAVVKDELISIASITAFHVDGSAMERLQKPEQENSLLYKNLQKSLRQVMDENKRIHDIYLMRKGSKENELLFVVDAVESPEEHAALGEVYQADIAPDMLNGFIEPSVDRDFTTDKWGQTLSGYAPVRNTKNEVVGILGIDFDANSIKDEFEHRREYVLFYTALGMIAMLGISMMVSRRLVRRLNNIKHVLDMLLEENLNVVVPDTGGIDEIKALASRVNQLTKKLVLDKEQMFMSSIAGLVNALEAKDEYTHGHSAEVAAIVKDIMQNMHLDEGEQFTIHFAAVLHDIGKIGIPDTILHKTGKLTDAEFDAIKAHPIIGAKILAGIPSLDEIQLLVRHHHERYDGRGYPDGLVGLDILLGARIIAVADSFQAMISDRPYRKGMSQPEAMRELERNKGTQFDPHIVDVFLAICKTKQYKAKK